VAVTAFSDGPDTVSGTPSAESRAAYCLLGTGIRTLVLRQSDEGLIRRQVRLPPLCKSTYKPPYKTPQKQSA